MNAISSSINKGAVKVAPKAGGSRRPRVASINTKKDVPKDIQSARTAQDLESSPAPSQRTHATDDAHDIALPTKRSIPVVASTASRTNHVAEITAQRSAPAAQIQRGRRRRSASEAFGVSDEYLSEALEDNSLSSTSISQVASKSHESTNSQRSASQALENLVVNETVSGRSQHIDLPVLKPDQEEEEELALDETQNFRTKRGRKSRYRRKLSSVNVEGDTEDESLRETHNAASDAKEKKKKDSRRRRACTPENSESNKIDATQIKMLDLCKDTRLGRKSSKYAQFARLAAEKRLKKLAPEAHAVDTTDQDAEPGVAGNEAKINNSSEQVLGDLGDSNDSRPPRVVTGAPQVRIVNGQIVLDVNSLQVDRAVRDSAQNDVGVEYVEENPMERNVNSRSYSKHSCTPRWDPLSTDIFYNGLSQWGTDFDMISRMFPSRTRKQIKNKYTLEERRNPSLITKALTTKVPVNMEEYAKASEISFRSIAELEGELSELRTRFEAERQQALQAMESRKLEVAEEVVSAVDTDGKRKLRKRQLDDGLELVGSIEEVEEQARLAALLAAQSSDDDAEEAEIMS